MHSTKLKKVGGSVMLVVPPVLLNLLQLKAGTTVAVEAERDKLIVRPQPRPRYTLAQLLAKSNYSRLKKKNREWIDAPAVGRELL